MISDAEDLARVIEESLVDAEKYGADRHDVADTLEELAEAVRGGHTDIPDHRGRWWHEVHGDQEADDGE